MASKLIWNGLLSPFLDLPFPIMPHPPISIEVLATPIIQYFEASFVTGGGIQTMMLPVRDSFSYIEETEQMSKHQV